MEAGNYQMGMLGLKIDVDTYAGMKRGVPALLRILAEFKVKATFFLSIGPDNSGRAALQLIKNPLFLKKMMRTNAPGLYGWRTAFYGTLLKAPLIALSFPDIVGEILDDGHEVQFHAWDHRRWQDELPHKSADWVKDWFAKGIAGFEKITGAKPTAFGAPSWLIDERVLRIVGEYEFAYLSCTRARSPFIHEIANILEIPSDLPCFEELDRSTAVTTLAGLINDGGDHVLPVHAEVEGGILQNQFRELLSAVCGGVSLLPLRELKDKLKISELPVRKYRMELLRGRHSPCAV